MSAAAKALAEARARFTAWELQLDRDARRAGHCGRCLWRHCLCTRNAARQVRRGTGHLS